MSGKKENFCVIAQDAASLPLVTLGILLALILIPQLDGIFPSRAFEYSAIRLRIHFWISDIGTRDFQVKTDLFTKTSEERHRECSLPPRDSRGTFRELHRRIP